MGWLHASPKTNGKQEPKARIKSMSNEEVQSLTPDVSDCYHIAELWVKAGKYDKTGMQASQLTWGEIESFSVFNPITPMEADIIYEMSESFIAGLNDTESKDPPTFELLDDNEKQEAIRRRVALQFRAMKESRRTKEA